MAMGIVNRDQMKEELDHFNNGRVKSEIEIIERDIVHGRGEGKRNTPQLVREFVAAEAIAGGDRNELAKTFQLSQSSISAYKNGATSTATYNEPNEKLARANDVVRETIIGSAQAKLIEALEAIDLTGSIKPNIAASVARDMSVITRNMTPELDKKEASNQKVVIIRPRMREEEEYEIIAVEN